VGRRGGGASGTVLAVIGFLAIIGVTFGSGFYAGRLTGPRPASSPGVDRDTGRGLGGARVAATTDMPDLTFYRELTAPMTTPPPPPRRSPAVSASPAVPEPPRRAVTVAPARPETPAPAAASSVALPPAPAREPRAAPGEPTPPSRTRYTVQVGAYRDRRPAEVLRASLVAAGHDAQLVEIDAPNGVRYRVRVGSFATREDAREAALRLTRSGVLSAFVTTRTSR
jgi:cell division septation protein DedD